MPAEKPVPRTSDARRSNKPIMEKRRRARINQCLNELKSLILEALRKDPSRHSKLEKADILEMTVKHLQNVQRQQMALAMASDPTVMSKFRSGFSECAREVSRYVSRIDGVESGIRQRLLAHLGHCLSGLNGMNPISVAGILPSAGAAGGGGGAAAEILGQMSHVHVGMPHALNVYPQLPFSVGDLNNNNTNAAARLLNSLSFFPGRLLTAGDIALLVPSQPGSGGGGGGVAAHLPASLLPLFSPSAPTAGATPSATVTCDSDSVLNPLKSDDDNNSAFTAISRGCLTSGPLSPVSTASTCTSGSSAFSPPLRDPSPEPEAPSLPAESSSDTIETTQIEEAGTSHEDSTQPSTSAADNDRMWRPW